MARVEIPAPGDLIMDEDGNVQANVTVSLKLAGTATDVTHYSALTGGTSTTGGLKSGSDGTIVDGSGNRRYVDSGVAMDLLIDGRTRQIEPLSASVDADVQGRALNVKVRYGAFAGAVGDGVADDSATIQARIDALSSAGGGVLFFPQGTYKTLTAIQIKNNVILSGAGREKAIIDASSVAASANGHYYGIQGKGTIGTPTLTTVDVKRGEMQAVVTSTSGLAAGDWVVLGSNAPRGTLNTTITSGSTTIVVNLSAGCAAFSARGYLAIGDEQIGYSSVAVAGSQYTFTIRAGALGRGAQGTTAAAATAGASVFEFNSGKYILWRPTAIDRGEIKRISSITGTTVVFEQPSNDDYPVTNAAFVLKVTPVTGFAIRGLTVKHPTTLSAHTEWGIGLEWCDDFTVQNCGVHYSSHINIGMNNCTRFKILGNAMYGKGISDPPPVHSLYGIATYNACQWGTISNNHAERASKLFTASSNTSGQSWWGQPRDITVTGNTLDNSAVGFYSRHPAYEVHGAGERITITGNTAHGADSIVSIQTAAHINVSNNVGSGWYRAGIIFSGAHELNAISITGNDVGSRTLGPGRTTLTADPGSGGTTINVVDTSLFLDDTTASVAQLVKIDSEVIRYTGVTATTFTGCTRAQNGTSAATHSIGAVATAFGNAAACPIYMDLTDCVWGQRAYDQPVTALTADPGAAGTTITVGDTTGFASAGIAVIEGEDSARNFEPEVVAYTGTTPTTLTGCTRGVEYTTAKVHTIGAFVMPYEIPVTQLKIANNQGEQDLDYYGMFVGGYTPTRQCSITGNQIKYTGASRATTNSCRVELHTVKVKLNEFYGWAFGYRAMGNGQLWQANESELSVQDATGGYGLRVEGFDCKVVDNVFSRHFQAVSIGTASCRAVVVRNVMDVPFSSRGITGWDVTTTAKDNTFILPSGQDLAAASATALILNCPGNYKWRVTGAVTVTSIPIQCDQTEVVLKFDGAPTITNVATVKLAGAVNFVATADDMLTLVSDGTAWREKCRSVN